MITNRHISYKKLKKHVGHNVIVALHDEGYEDPSMEKGAVIKCGDCNEVLIAIKEPDIYKYISSSSTNILFYSSYQNRVLNSPIFLLDLGTRARRCLDRLGIEWVWEAVSLNGEELIEKRLMGAGSLAELVEALGKYGMSLKMNLSEFGPGSHEPVDFLQQSIKILFPRGEGYADTLQDQDIEIIEDLLNVPTEKSLTLSLRSLKVSLPRIRRVYRRLKQKPNWEYFGDYRSEPPCDTIPQSGAQNTKKDLGTGQVYT